MIYKVSYVILGGKVPGAIINQDRAPVVGEKIDIMSTRCEVTEVQDLLPPQGDFAYLHVTCRVIEDETE